MLNMKMAEATSVHTAGAHCGCTLQMHTAGAHCRCTLQILASKITANQSTACGAPSDVQSRNLVAGRLTNKAAHGDLAHCRLRGAGVEAKQVWGADAQATLQRGGWRSAGGPHRALTSSMGLCPHILHTAQATSRLKVRLVKLAVATRL